MLSSKTSWHLLEKDSQPVLQVTTFHSLTHGSHWFSFFEDCGCKNHPVQKAMVPPGNDSFLAPASTIQKATLAHLKWCWVNSTGQKDLTGMGGWLRSPSNPPPLSPCNPYQLTEIPQKNLGWKGPCEWIWSTLPLSSPCKHKIQALGRIPSCSRTSDPSSLGAIKIKRSLPAP